MDTLITIILSEDRRDKGRISTTNILSDFLYAYDKLSKSYQ